MLDRDKSGGFAWSVLKKWPLGPIILGRLGPSWAILGHLGPSSSEANLRCDFLRMSRTVCSVMLKSAVFYNTVLT